MNQSVELFGHLIRISLGVLDVTAASGKTQQVSWLGEGLLQMYLLLAAWH